MAVAKKTPRPADTDSVSVTVSPSDADRVGVHTAPAAPGRVRSAIEDKAFSLAAAGHALGEPRSAPAAVPDTPAWQQVFDAAWVIWHPTYGACALRRHSPIARLYAMTGGPSGYLGCPVTDEITAGAGTICTFEATGSAMAWHPHLGAHLVHGAIGEYWLDTGGPEGRWGFPISDEYDAGNGLQAIDFEGGTLTWRKGSGIGLQPRAGDREHGEWLALLDEPPRRASGVGKTSLRPGAPSVPMLMAGGRSHLRFRHDDAGVVAEVERIEARRGLIGSVDPPPAHRRPEDMVTTVTPDEVRQFNDTPLPEGVSDEELFEAELELWRNLWSSDTGPSTIGPLAGAALSWLGFVADGDLEFLVRTLFARSPAARELLVSVGMSVEQVGGRFAFVAADTQRGWRLYGVDAERLIRSDARLTALLVAIAEGAVAPDLLAAAALKPEVNAELRQATSDAQFLTVVARAGRLPGWSLVPPWTADLRAAVVHNLHVGCLTGWQAYAHTRGDPVEVVRAMTWDFFCGPAALLSQSRARFEGSLSHGVLGAAARWFPPVTVEDDGQARYIVAGSVRRRVDAQR